MGKLHDPTTTLSTWAGSIARAPLTACSQDFDLLLQSSLHLRPSWSLQPSRLQPLPRARSCRVTQHSKTPDLKPSGGRVPMLETCKLASISSRYTSSKTNSLAAFARPSQIAPSWTHCAVQMDPYLATEPRPPYSKS